MNSHGALRFMGEVVASVSTRSASSGGWAGVDSELAKHVRKQASDCLGSYRAQNNRVDEDHASEQSHVAGGYTRKQIVELIQNGGDQLTPGDGRLEVILTDKCLYAANTGEPFSADGITAIMTAHSSPKSGNEMGQYGLGFKSVVGVSDTPQVFSRSISLGFDRARSLEQIKEIVPNCTDAPVLRLAEPLDPHAYAAKDPVLAELMEWATTIIRLPLRSRKDIVPNLIDDMQGFDPMFLVFGSKSAGIRLTDRINDRTRTISQSKDDSGRVTLTDSKSRAAMSFRVFSLEHTPSREAWDDFGEVGRMLRANPEAEKSVTLQWAVPEKDRNKDGRFFAFFPTAAGTTLSGAINAPWKLGNDRVTLIEGAYNKELLREALPKLISETLPQLVNDPSAVALLDLLPARCRRGEERSWADFEMNVPIFDALRTTPSLADCAGQLRIPSELKVPPKGLDDTAKELWLSSSPSLEAWVSSDTDGLERRVKVERLVGSEETSSLEEWVEALAPIATHEYSARAIELAAHLAEIPEFSAEAIKSRVLLLENGSLVAPRAGTVFLRSHPDETDYAFVAAELAEDAEVRRNLQRLGIQALDTGGQLRHELNKPGVTDWKEVWEKSRGVTINVAESIFETHFGNELISRLRVRNAAGEWTPIDGALLAGAVIPADGSRDVEFLIDPVFHAADTELLRRLGATDQLLINPVAPKEEWVAKYEEGLKARYVETKASARGAKPDADKLTVDSQPTPWPLGFIGKLTPEAAMRLTQRALELDNGHNWTVRHRTFGELDGRSPVSVLLHKSGYLPTRLGPWPVAQCLSNGFEWSDADLQVLPVAQVVDEQSQRMKLAESPGGLSEEAWDALLVAARGWESAERRAILYAWACDSGVEAPETLTIGDGGRAHAKAPEEIAVSCDAEEYRALIAQKVNVIFVDRADDKERLIEKWGLLDGSPLLQREHSPIPSGSREALLNRLPGLRIYLDDSYFELELQPCSSIQRLTATADGQDTELISEWLGGNCVYVTSSDEREMVKQVAKALGLDLELDEIEALLDRQRDDEARKLSAELKLASTDADRFLLAFGVESLRTMIPRLALEAAREDLARDLEPIEIARMAMAVHGYSLLSAMRNALNDKGLEPPQQWAGSGRAQRFVTDLGFPVEYAGSPGVSRPENLEVEGPVVLPPLHDYQEFVTDRIKGVIRGKLSPRGLVALPTGAGKTRVAVQALTEEFAEGNLTGFVLWIAQSDELCEQAVQTWASVWRSVGPRQRLNISRFWGSNEATPQDDGFQLIVATNSKLDMAREKEEYDWLTKAEVVVVDEAHISVAKTYQRVLKWLGRWGKGANRGILLGLTATPFRNFNSTETELLAEIYRNNRLDDGAFGYEITPHEKLQADGILARVRQKTLDGASIEPTQKEQDDFKGLGGGVRVPSALLERIGQDVDRNRRIVDDLSELCIENPDWPVLLFTTSVENASVLAAQLTMRGIRAVAISGETETSARRRYIEEFTNGDIQVIANHSILTQGFDAPKVRAIYVTRPCYSPNEYQQMIGRGLRGPLNGGSEEVLIVNMDDNIENFGTQLAFNHFENLWKAK